MRDSGFQNPRLSPDGKQLALGAGDDIWLYDIERQTSSRLTEEGANSYPGWTPDGTAVTLGSDRSGTFDLYQKAGDGSGVAEPLLERSTALFP